MDKIPETLKGILEDNKDTEFGKNHHFSEIKSIEEYKKQVPLSHYKDYKDYIDRMRKGETNLITVYPVLHYLCSSGTTGPQKLIPCTQKSIQASMPVVKKQAEKLSIHKNEKEKTLFMSAFNLDINNVQDQILIMSEGFYYFVYKYKIMDFNKYVDKDIMFDPDIIEFLYEKVWCAIVEENIVSLESVYLYGVLQFFNYLEKNYKEIISDIRNNRINPEKKISDKAKKFLLNLKYSEERLDFVEKECAKGFENIAGRIWKNFRFVSGISNKAFKYQNESLDYFIGNVNKDTFVYGLSECLAGLSLEYNVYEYYIAPTSGFFEFLPFSEDEKDKDNNLKETKNYNEVEVGKDYELILTNYSGFYRYRTGDILRIVRNDEKGVFIEFCRRDRSLSFAGEKTNHAHLEEVMEVMHELIPNILDYKLGATIFDNAGTYYLFLCLLDKSKVDLSLDEITKKFDELLGKVNYLYQLFRNQKTLGYPKVYLIDAKEYSILFQTEICKKSHNKAKVLLSEQELKEILKKMEHF